MSYVPRYTSQMNSDFYHSKTKLKFPYIFSIYYLNQFVLLSHFITRNVFIIQIKPGGLEQCFCICDPLTLINQVRQKMLQFYVHTFQLKAKILSKHLLLMQRTGREKYKRPNDRHVTADEGR